MSQERITPVFTSRGWFYHRKVGSGYAALVQCDQDRPRKPQESGLLGPVVIDGGTFECVGVESYALECPLRKWEDIILLLREEP